ncbi:MAG TPA: thymidine phosphorylase, partial [Gemmatimonadales bacterium]|nr:thymidine phosphorylase [Gemmatimonadales bacterium]
MVIQTLIERKRDGGALTPEEWRGAVMGLLDGRVPDYQMAALLMAVTWRGLTQAELEALTEIMLASGARWPKAPGRVDKHSTGGVGDKVSLVLAPLVASCGVRVPMMSGRGLGHTGGTVDKLEAIPGFRTGLSLEEAERQVDRLGCALFRQTAEIAPADGRLYALRDVTGTVPSIPLIAASIMSKKLAEGLSGLVLDVKVGSGAFLPGIDQARTLARTMVALGAGHGCPTVALLTAMDRPLGRACGNALEIEEAIATLSGEGPADLVELTLALGAEMLVLGGVEPDLARARIALEGALASGRARELMARIIEAQGGNPGVIDDPGVLPQAAAVEIFDAPRAGVVQGVEPRAIGEAVVAMGGGRRRLEDSIDPSVGFVITPRPGDRVAAGQPLASVFARDSNGIAVGMEALKAAIVIAEGPADWLPLIIERIAESSEGGKGG